MGAAEAEGSGAMALTGEAFLVEGIGRGAEAMGAGGRSDATTETFDFLGFFLGGSTTAGSASATGAFLTTGVGVGLGREGLETEARGAATALVEVVGVGLAIGVDEAGKEAMIGATCESRAISGQYL